MSAITPANLVPWHDPAFAKPLKADAPTTKPSFKDFVGADYVVGSKNVQKSPHEQLVESTQKWVAQTFYGTILKQMHDSPFRSEIFDGGRGGQAFGGLMDQHLSDHMARGTNNKLVRAIVRKIEARQAYAKKAAEQQQNRSGTDVTTTA